MYLMSLINIIIVYFIYRSFFRYNAGYILLTHVDIEDADDKELLDFIAGEKKKFNLTILVNLFLIILGYLLDSYNLIGAYSMVFWYFIIILPYFLAMYRIQLSIYNLRAFLKLNYDYNEEEAQVEKVDIIASRELEETIDLKGLLLAYLIFLPAIIISIISPSTDLRLFTLYSLSILLSISLSIYILLKRPNQVFSNSTEENIAYNKMIKLDFYKRSNFINNLYSLFSLIAVYLIWREKLSFYKILNLNIVLSLFPVFYIIFFYIKNMKKLSDRLLETKAYSPGSKSYLDILGYNNPNDERVFIHSKETSLGGLYINRGSKKGRLLFNILLGLIIIVCIFPLFLMTPTNYKASLEDSTLKLQAKIYKDQIELDHIESVSIKTSLPEKLLRSNGTASKWELYGSFRGSKNSKYRLYVYRDRDDYIEIKLKDKSTILLTLKDREENYRFYKELEERLGGIR